MMVGKKKFLYEKNQFRYINRSFKVFNEGGWGYFYKKLFLNLVRSNSKILYLNIYNGLIFILM